MHPLKIAMSKGQNERKKVSLPLGIGTAGVDIELSLLISVYQTTPDGYTA